MDFEFHFTCEATSQGKCYVLEIQNNVVCSYCLLLLSDLKKSDIGQLVSGASQSLQETSRKWSLYLMVCF